MPDTVIKVENISKQYRLGMVGATSIADDLKRNWARVRGKEDPTLKIGQSNTLTTGSKIQTTNNKPASPTGRQQTSDYVWALKDINFEVKQGEVLGIIGKNGAGKSTLLKILSKVTSPTKGDVKIKGRIASLLEVGTGFHSELSGRENIFLNGAILGMTKAEIKSKFDEIVDFSGIERYIDTPVKRYSSGMYVRLAFAVAAHLDPDILILDEVLAVGDAEFQKKCLGKMGEVAKGGRTILFVSHNLASVRSLCKKSMLLNEGEITGIGDTANIISQYLLSNKSEKNAIVTLIPDSNANVSFTKIWITDSQGNLNTDVDVLNPFMIGLEFKVLHNTTNTEISIGLTNSNDVKVLFSSLSDGNDKGFVELKPGIHKASIWLQEKFLVPDTYTVRISAHYPGKLNIDTRENVFRFAIIETGSTMFYNGAVSWCCVLGGAKWSLK